jgi:hypothetical protein
MFDPVMNGRAWSSADIAALIDAVERQQCLVKLAARLDRTETAVMSKANRLMLKPHNGAQSTELD